MSEKTAGSSKEKVWKRSATEGIYLHVPSAIYYARYSQNGVRKFKSLETGVLTHARVKRSELMVAVEISRLRGAPSEPVSTLKTLGDVTARLVEQLGSTTQKAATKNNYLQQLAALKNCWPGGKFESTLPSSVTYETLLRLRENLKSVRWKGHLHRRAGVGYSNAYTNQVLARLNNVLVLARSLHLCGHDPFAERVGLQGEIFLPLNQKAPRLPSTAEMDRIFHEITNVVAGKSEIKPLLEWRVSRAMGASEHARFLAYSGCRLSEANNATFEDDHGTSFHVRGTKSKPSDREIPCVKAFRSLLDEIKARRKAEGGPTTGPILTVKSSRDAIKNACHRLGLKKLGHHHLRHYFATVCIESGVDIPTVSRWLGHSDGGPLAMRVYGHLRKEHSLAQASKVSFSPQRSEGSTAG
ncbi:MAG TPA: tyrosine-type recombinase/integrase [Opitutaceae bacterium]|nr:tyrosine-type recombinase/integrase [Opitutaceae bacterium]